MILSCELMAHFHARKSSEVIAFGVFLFHLLRLIFRFLFFPGPGYTAHKRAARRKNILFGESSRVKPLFFLEPPQGCDDSLAQAVRPGNTRPPTTNPFHRFGRAEPVSSLAVLMRLWAHKPMERKNCRHPLYPGLTAWATPFTSLRPVEEQTFSENIHGVP